MQEFADYLTGENAKGNTKKELQKLIYLIVRLRIWDEDFELSALALEIFRTNFYKCFLCSFQL